MATDLKNLRTYALGISILSLMLLLWGAFTLYLLATVPDDASSFQLLERLYHDAFFMLTGAKMPFENDIFTQVLRAHGGIDDQVRDLQWKMTLVAMTLAALQGLLSLAFWYETRPRGPARDDTPAA